MGVCVCVYVGVFVCVYWVLVGYVCKWFGVLDKEYRAFERSFLCTNFFELLIASDKLKAGPNDQDNALAKTPNGPQRTTNWLCIEHAQHNEQVQKVFGALLKNTHAQPCIKPKSQSLVTPAHACRLTL